MPKQYLSIRDWSGGINTRRDPRDIAENEFVLIQNMSVDALGKVKTSGKFYPHIESQDGSTDLTEYIVERTANLVGSGGYGFFYFESDHSPNSTQVITETKSGTALQIGSSDGQISFQFIETQPDSQNFDPGEDEVSPR